MNKVTVMDVNSEDEAKGKCLELYRWYPDAVREVDSGEEGIRAWMCFESAADAELWDKQI